MKMMVVMIIVKDEGFTSRMHADRVETFRETSLHGRVHRRVAEAVCACA